MHLFTVVLMATLALVSSVFAAPIHFSVVRLPPARRDPAPTRSSHSAGSTSSPRHSSTPVPTPAPTPNPGLIVGEPPGIHVSKRETAGDILVLGSHTVTIVPSGATATGPATTTIDLNSPSQGPFPIPLPDFISALTAKPSA